MIRRVAALFVVLVAACGGPKPTTIGNESRSAGGGLALLPGIYPCAFMFEGQGYGPFKCTVAGDQVTKEGGMEPWTGRITAMAGGVHLDAKVGCGEMSTKCNAPFTVDLVKDASGTFSGKVVGTGDWWLNGQGLEIRKAGMGGDQYGGVQPDN